MNQLEQKLNATQCLNFANKVKSYNYYYSDITSLPIPLVGIAGQIDGKPVEVYLMNFNSHHAISVLYSDSLWGYHEMKGPENPIKELYDGAVKNIEESEHEKELLITKEIMELAR